jgi:diguanylate cyclase (GGDEF)-like protein
LLTPEPLTFYWIFVARATGALVIACVLLGFHRRYRRTYLRSWAWSWLFLGVRLVSMGAGLALLSRLAADHPYRLLNTAVGQVAGYLQILWLLLGSDDFARERAGNGRGRALLSTGAIVLGLVSTCLFASTPGLHHLRHLVRVGIPSTLATVGFLVAAALIWRLRGSQLAFGPKLVSAALLLYGLENGYEAFVSAYWLAAGQRLPEGVALSLVDFVLQLLMGLGMVICLLEDERQAALAAAGQAEHLAYHDPLTELPNRQLFLDRLALALAQATRDQRKVAVFFLDLDRFKVINDSLGHTVGDWLLHEAGRRVQTLVRQTDTLARFGGDEFTLLVTGLHQSDEAGRIAQKLLEAIHAPFLIEGRELFVTTSIGVSVFPEDAQEAEALIRNADTAMYRAKEQGRDTFQLYTPAMNAQARERLALENSLRKAVERNELVLHYQPIVEAQTGRILGAEALLRWAHPERGLLLPRDFIEIAEATGIIVSMTPWILATASAQARAWQERGHPGFVLSVNLSARQFLDAGIVKKVGEALAVAGLPPSCLELEITEDQAMQTAEETLDTMRRLKALGVGLSIDDFGTGHSSLAKLSRFPLDRLKIDQSFVRDMIADHSAATIVATILLMANSLGLRVVAEGVEREDQLAFLRKRGCEQVQGFLFSQGVEPALFDGLLRGGRLPVSGRPEAAIS